MNKICTSIEQSKKLIELGIDVNTADIIYNALDIPYIRRDTPIDKYCTPAWSLSVLMELISPGNILLRDALNGKYKCINTIDSDFYETPIDAAFEIVCWLLENNNPYRDDV